MDVGRNPRSLATVTRAQKGKTGEKGGGDVRFTGINA